MLSPFSGSFRLFRVAGIQVRLHWSWFVVGWIEIATRSRAYDSPVWNVLEYLGLFAIVLLHEFGHVLACRQVGGSSEDIVLWPLGGVALAKPPPRAGAELWTIAAGPLVNVVLFPVLMLATEAWSASGWGPQLPDLSRFLFMLWLINKWLLLFNLLPVYPLDGGQILRSLLWFRLGRARSLRVATGLGFAGLVVLAAYRLAQRPTDWLWTLVFAYFLGQQCLAGWRHAAALRVLEALPRHVGLRCRSCGAAPPRAPVWLCPGCGVRFDAPASGAVCPQCFTALPALACADCGAAHPPADWGVGPRPRGGAVGPVIDI